MLKFSFFAANYTSRNMWALGLNIKYQKCLHTLPFMPFCLQLIWRLMTTQLSSCLIACLTRNLKVVSWNSDLTTVSCPWLRERSLFMREGGGGGGKRRDEWKFENFHFFRIPPPKYLKKISDPPPPLLQVTKCIIYAWKLSLIACEYCY